MCLSVTVSVCVCVCVLCVCDTVSAVAYGWTTEGLLKGESVEDYFF